MLRLGGRRAAALRFQALASLGLVAPASATYASKSSYEAAQQTEGGAWRWAALAGVGLAAAGTGYSLTQQPSLADAKPQSYTRDEVAKHKTKEQRIWVTYKDGVYDVTEFIEAHPGGKEKILMAAGGAVDPFWNIYQQHHKSEVQDILKEYRIGTLSGSGGGGASGGSGGSKSEGSESSSGGGWLAALFRSSSESGKGGSPAAEGARRRGIDPANPWANEPSRNPALISRSTNPCNAETPSVILAANLITPTELFYVRNHLPVPDIDGSEWRLVVEGEGLRRVVLDLETLQTRFKKHTLAATVQCSGNRRHEMKEIKPVKGLDWDTGAIGTAVWGGVRLLDVLRAAGVNEDDPEARHIHFEGADVDPLTGDKYITSIPVEVAVDRNRDVLLAYEMNGQPLTRDHGYPVRVIAPGISGCRSVKWITRVLASPQESSSHWQQNDYKSFSPSTDWDTVDWNSAPAIQEAPVTSAITEPSNGHQIPKGSRDVTVRGYAWSGGGRDVVRVDVSSDGGKTWTSAQLKKLPQRPGRAWAWTLWEAEVPLPQDATGPIQLISKAVDSSYNSQPDSVEGIWNLRGVVNNAWHRVNISVSA